MIFVSHLDMNRYILRLLKLSKLPVWFTEGFNPHPYITFALPLSLGFESEYEVVDFRVTDDSLKNEEILLALKNVAVPGIEIFKVSEPKQKSTVISKAEYLVEFSDCFENNRLEQFLKSDSIVIEKLTKKKKLKQVDIAPMIFDFNLKENSLLIQLSAGNTDNLNPSVVLETFKQKCSNELPFYKITRTKLLTFDGTLFE